MNANKLFSEFSLKKIWDKLLQHDKAMSSTLLILNSGNWVEQEDDTFKNTVSYSTFKDTDKLTVDLYDDGNLSETQLTEYEQYIDSFEIVNGALVAIANTKPTQTFTVVVKGDFEVNQVDVTYIEYIDHLESEDYNVGLSANQGRILNEKNVALQNLFNSINERLVYIEENLGTLTSEEYTCSGSVSFYAEDYATVYQSIVFDRIFLEPPTVATKFTYNQDGQFTSSSASNITTSGCTISAHIGCTSGRSCTVQWTAIGLVRKQTS